MQCRHDEAITVDSYEKPSVLLSSHSGETETGETTSKRGRFKIVKVVARLSDFSFSRG